MPGPLRKPTRSLPCIPPCPARKAPAGSTATGSPPAPLPRRPAEPSHPGAGCGWWLLALGCLGAWGGTSAAEPPPPGEAALDQAIQAHVEFLADDLLEGRGTGSPGHELAARYVVAQFRQRGLQPGGLSNRWYQAVPLLESRLVPDSARVELSSADATQVLEPNLDYLASPDFRLTNTVVTAPLVFAGYGVRAPELNHDDLAGLDLNGRIAVVLAKAPPRFPATALAHHAHPRQKAGLLAARGAVGVITVPTPKDLEESPWARQIQQSRFPGMRWVQPDGTPAEVFPSLQASLRVSPQGAGRLFARSPKPLADTLAAGARSEVQSFPLHQTATIRLRSEHRRLSSPNVIGILPGSDPRLAGESVVLTAHLDHVGRGPEVNGDSIYNGAYDNAIGVALLIETAGRLARDGRRPRRTVVFAAVTGEEKGLRGSEYLAEHLPPAAGRPVANINLDMVLLGAPSRRLTILGIEHSSLRQPVEAAARHFGLELVPDPRPDRVTFIRSDQYAFIRTGVPAIFPKVAEAPGGAVPPGALTVDAYLRQHYHQPSDEASLPRDAASTVRFAGFISEVTRRVADAAQRPRWNPGDFFGETFGGSPGVR